MGRQERGMERPSASMPELQAGAPKRALRVLLIDDHVLVLRSLSRLLSDCDTVVRSNSGQALKLLQSGAQFDAIVSDVMMPGLSGPELCARCYQSSPELARRFVFTSADPAAARELMGRTMAQVPVEPPPILLGKPTSHEALMAAIFAVASGAPHKSGTYQFGHQAAPLNPGDPLVGQDLLLAREGVGGGLRRPRH